jgi:hypothetical protein
MARKSKAIADFQAKYKVAEDELWEVHGSTWCVKHKALERIAAEVGIVWEKPELKVCDMANGLIAILVGGRLGEHLEFSFGEASPKNNKNAYPIAMAEKRAKDRVILKLLAVHGDLYSEEEADDFKRQNPHVTRAADVHDEISTDIPHVDVPKMKVKQARGENGAPGAYEVLLAEMRRYQDAQELYDWGQEKAKEIHALPGEWPQHFKGEYAAHKKSISNGKAA